MPKTSDYYRRLQYTRLVRIETDEMGTPFFVASIRELPGVEGIGDSEVEARSELASAFVDYVEAMLEWGEEIPEPKQWPESFGWAPEAAGAVAGTVQLAALVGIDIGAQATAVSAFDGVVDQAQREAVAA